MEKTAEYQPQDAFMEGQRHGRDKDRRITLVMYGCETRQGDYWQSSVCLQDRQRLLTSSKV